MYYLRVLYIGLCRINCIDWQLVTSHRTCRIFRSYNGPHTMVLTVRVITEWSSMNVASHNGPHCTCHHIMVLDERGIAQWSSLYVASQNGPHCTCHHRMVLTVRVTTEWSSLCHHTLCIGTVTWWRHDGQHCPDVSRQSENESIIMRFYLYNIYKYNLTTLLHTFVTLTKDVSL